VEARIREVAAEISERYRGRSLKLIGVLKGSVFFLTALEIDFLANSTLLDRTSRRIPQVPVEFRCFEIGERRPKRNRGFSAGP